MNATNYHRIIVPRRGPPEVMQWVADDLSAPAPGQARVKVEAAGVSGYDIMLRGHWFPGFTKTPYTPGEDVVGVVDAVGGGVTAIAPGQRVAGWTFGDAGGYAEYVCRPADQLVPAPTELDPAVAAALVTNYLTASLALHKTARATRGERVLVHGAAGGVGSALLQLGKLAGLEMFGTGAGAGLEFIAANDAVPVDYRHQDFVGRIRELTGGDGVDVVIDLVGGPRQLWRSYRCLRRGGRLLMLGMAGVARSGVGVIPPSLLVVGALAIWPDGRRTPMSPSMLSYPGRHLDWYRETLSRLLAMTADGRLAPAVAVQVPLREAARAHSLLERGGLTGKIVLIDGG
ncbi:MAG: zinc-binding dehydrogenase [Kiloniellales bacterium]